MRRRRRISRTLAAWHLLRHGALIYGVHFKGGVHVAGSGGRDLLITYCLFEGDPSPLPVSQFLLGHGRGEMLK